MRVDLRKEPTLHKTWYFAIFQTVTTLWLQAFHLVCRQFRLHRSNVRSYSKPPVLSSELPNWGKKQRRLMCLLTPPTPEMRATWNSLQVLLAGWWKSIHAKAQVHSCYGSRDIRVEKWKFRKCTKFPQIRSHGFISECPELKGYERSIDKVLILTLIQAKNYHCVMNMYALL